MSLHAAHQLVRGAAVDYYYAIAPEWVQSVTLLFLLCAATLASTSLFKLVNVFRCLWYTNFLTKNPAEGAGNISPGNEPCVTIQICCYNEVTVIEDTIDAACQVEWPRDKLFVQLLDDSTDGVTRPLIERRIDYWRKQGVNVCMRTRSDRVGYKAGSLRYHFDSIPSEFVAQFDADHRMSTDFLRRAMPHFFHTDGTEKKMIGLVQTPWAYYNTHTNALTEMDAVSLDLHHVIEQVGRCSALGVFGFNGTGGIWRRSAIDAGGGWSWETVTEDLALSYMSAAKGYRFAYVRDLPQKLEVPACILAHIQQKHRWTKGFFQVLRMYYPQIATCPNFTLVQKMEALVHFTDALQCCLFLSILLFYPIISIYDLSNTLLVCLLACSAFQSFVCVTVGVLGKVPAKEDGDYVTILSRLVRLIIFGSGVLIFKPCMCIFEIRAMLEGLFSNDSTFITTPKDGRKSDSNRVSTAQESSTNKPVAYIGIMVALYRIHFLYVEYQEQSYKFTTVEWYFFWYNCILSPCLLLVNMLVLRAEWKRKNGNKAFLMAQKRGLLGRGNKYGLLLVGLLSTICMFGMSLNMSPGAHLNEEQQRNLESAMSSCSPQKQHQSNKEYSWSCPPKHCDSKTLTKRRPIIIFSDPGSGSNLLTTMLDSFTYVLPASEINVLSTYELFNPSNTTEEFLKNFESNTLAKACANSGQSSESAGASLLDDGKKKWQEVQSKRFTDPVGMINYLEKIPSKARRSFLTINVFDKHVHVNLKTNIESLLDKMIQTENGIEGGKFIVLWRRRTIEEFVSDQLQWVNELAWNGTTDDTTMKQLHVEKADFEKFIQEKHNYYSTLRTALVERRIPFEVFEYDTDLHDSDKQLRTMKLMQKSILEIPGTVNLKEMLRKVNMLVSKPSVDVSQAVANWDEVVEWGYGGGNAQWEDFFERETRDEKVGEDTWFESVMRWML